MANLQKSDGRIFASYPMPRKIDLLNERPRRDSLLEQQLDEGIKFESHGMEQPRITVTEQTTTTVVREVNNGMNHDIRQPTQQTSASYTQNYQEPIYGYRTINQISQEVPRMNQAQSSNQGQSANRQPMSNTINKTNAAALLAVELAEKEAKLMKEITAFHQRPYSPFKTPDKIDLTSEQRAIQQQYQNAPSPRAGSRSSMRSPSADLLEKEAKLLQEIEEIESKPYNPQTMVVERDQWFELENGRPGSRNLVDSRRRLRDFCNVPPGLSEERHIHEEHISSLQASPTPGSIHTTIIRSPKREIDNKSPLPFAFDNFTTKGVRGNIASVGAVEPERPRPPIYPIVKRTPSPSFARE